MRSIILILVILNVVSCGTQLKCCLTINDVEANLNGIWKLKGSDSNALDRYNFEIGNGKGHLSIIEPTPKNGEYITIDDHPFVEIIKTKRKFHLKYISLQGSYMVELIYLNNNKMILKSNKNGFVSEYYKIKN